MGSPWETLGRRRGSKKDSLHGFLFRAPCPLHQGVACDCSVFPPGKNYGNRNSGPDFSHEWSSQCTAIKLNPNWQTGHKPRLPEIRMAQPWPCLPSQKRGAITFTPVGKVLLPGRTPSAQNCTPRSKTLASLCGLLSSQLSLRVTWCEVGGGVSAGSSRMEVGNLCSVKSQEGNIPIFGRHRASVTTAHPESSHRQRGVGRGWLPVRLERGRGSPSHDPAAQHARPLPADGPRPRGLGDLLLDEWNGPPK